MTKKEVKNFNRGVADNTQRFGFASERLDGLTKKYYSERAGMGS